MRFKQKKEHHKGALFLKITQTDMNNRLSQKL